jgi:hypothetical protein
MDNNSAADASGMLLLLLLLVGQAQHSSDSDQPRISVAAMAPAWSHRRIAMDDKARTETSRESLVSAAEDAITIIERKQRSR